MKISANSIRAGNVLVHKEKLYVVSKQPEHTKPGKGGAFVQVEMKELKSGTKVNERFSSTEMVEKARLDQKKYQYLFDSGEMLTFMDTEDFEQIELNKTILGDMLVYLQENMEVMIEFFEESALSVTLPETVILEVSEAEPVIKGQTAAASYKPAIMENGARVMVPPFVSMGDKIVVRTSDSTYVERAK